MLLRDGDKGASVLWKRIAGTIRAVQADSPAHWFESEEGAGNRKRTKG
jgi:hypothetical protein